MFMVINLFEITLPHNICIYVCFKIIVLSLGKIYYADRVPTDILNHIIINLFPRYSHVQV